MAMPAQGKLFAATVIHAAPGALARCAPYVVGLVDLDDGPRVLLPVFAPEGYAVLPDAPLRLFIADHTDGAILAACPADAPLATLRHEPRKPLPMSFPTPSQTARRPDRFRALMARRAEGAKTYSVSFEDIGLTDLPDGDVLVRITHSGLNYKDALALTGRAPIIRSFPMVPGIDLVGVVADSRSARFSPGDNVLVNGWGLSETRWGGYAEFQSLPESMLTPCPKGFTAEETMLVGTAGYTAMLCVEALQDHGLKPGADAVLVTGATGGVGSVAVALLARMGFPVIAVTGRETEAGFLKTLGATDVISRAELAEGGAKALSRERWAGAVDVAGGATLAQVLAQTRYDGAVACCGMAGGGELPATVYPFILRGVTLRGVDSVMVPQARRARAWEDLDRLLDRDLLHSLGQCHDFADLPDLAERLLSGQLKGRTAVRIG
jgi:acrylyl-CoA reductase (NADPH)